MWTTEKVKELLQLVEIRPILWDVSDENYKKKIFRTKAIDEISEIIGIENNEIKKKIHNLRCTFRKVLKSSNKKKSGSSTDKITTIKWEFYEDMKFMYKSVITEADDIDVMFTQKKSKNIANLMSKELTIYKNDVQRYTEMHSFARPEEVYIEESGILPRASLYNESQHIKTDQSVNIQTVLTELKKITSEITEIKKNQNDIMKSIADINAKLMADNKINRNCLVLLRRVNKNMNFLTGEEKSEFEDEICNLFPIKCIPDLMDFEERLCDEKFAIAVTNYLRKQMLTMTIDQVLRHIANDIVYFDFNYNGTSGKRKLMSLELFKTILFDSCPTLFNRNECEKEIKKFIHRSHNRHSVAKFATKKKMENV